jgi:23S rRNA (guanosine2251-2'-O)-methyltransferase
MIIYGKQVCLYALDKHADRIKRVYLAKKGILPQQLFERFRGVMTFVDNRRAQALSRGGNHQGILLEMASLETVPLSDLKNGNFVLVLDGLTDAGNIGAIARTAYALGVDGIVASGVRQLNMAAMVRTSAGALLDMPLCIQPNILDAMHELSQAGFRHYGASMEGAAIEAMRFATRRVLVLGNEAEGISKKARSKLDATVSIPMRRAFDSLNVSAAAAILIHRMSYAVE